MRQVLEDGEKVFHAAPENAHGGNRPRCGMPQVPHYSVRRTEAWAESVIMAKINRSPHDARNAQIIALLESGELPKVVAGRFHLSVFGVYKVRARFHMKHVQICPNCLLVKTPQPH